MMLSVKLMENIFTRLADYFWRHTFSSAVQNNGTILADSSDIANAFATQFELVCTVSDYMVLKIVDIQENHLEVFLTKLN